MLHDFVIHVQVFVLSPCVGEDVTETSVQDRNLGMVFQSYALFRHMTLAENIAFGLNVRKLDVDKEQR